MVLTKAQLTLIDGAGEEEFTRLCKSRAKKWGWNGIHVRDSEGVMESLHTKRLDGYSEAYGVPDWLFWHEVLEEAFWAELKGASGHLSPHQKREIPSMQRGGLTVFTWWPKHAQVMETIFENGVKAWMQAACLPVAR